MTVHPLRLLVTGLGELKVHHTLVVLIELKRLNSPFFSSERITFEAFDCVRQASPPHQPSLLPLSLRVQSSIAS